MADLVSIYDTEYVAVDTVDLQLLETDSDSIGIVEYSPQVVEASATTIEIVIVNDTENIVFTDEPLSYISDTCSGGTFGGLDIYDEGGLVSKGVTSLNFIGSTVTAKKDGAFNVNVYIPLPSYVSHFNTADGLAPCLLPDITTFNRFISSPTSVGVPFSIGDWSPNTIHQVISNGLLTYSTDTPCSFVDTTTTFDVVIFGDGSSIIYEFVSPVITGNGVFISANSSVVISVSGWNTDVDKFQAQVSFQINIPILLKDGGRFGVSLQHKNSTDGTFIKVQNNLFYDPNTNAASIGTTSILPRQTISSRYLSGLRYYYLNDIFTLGAYNLDYLNSNSYPQPFIAIDCSDYAIESPQLSAADLQNWTPAWDNQDAFYEGDHKITQEFVRFIGDASITTGVLDWGVAKSVTSLKTAILIDTFPQESTALVEHFTDEYYRQKSDFSDGFPDGNWFSDQDLVLGDAMVFGGHLITPSMAYSIDHNPERHLSNFYSFFPKREDNTDNPDYSLLTCPINYYRTFTHTAPEQDIPNYQLYIEGSFVNGSALKDIEAGLIEIYIRRMESPMTNNFGPTATPMTIHGLGYSFGEFDDGVTNGCVRMGNSNDTFIGATAGGLTIHRGIHFHIRMLNPSIRLDSIRVEFN